MTQLIINGYDFYRKDCINKGGGETEIIIKTNWRNWNTMVKMQSGFYASFIVSAIYNHPNEGA